MTKSLRELDTVVIRFAGDSGDGMQLTGMQFTMTSTSLGNDVHTFADFPAEIRAPAGTLPGVSGFQLSLSQRDIHTPGDRLQALIAMNPAALKVNLNDLETGGLLLLNEDSFNDKDLKKAGYDHNPLAAGELNQYRLFAVPITELTLNAVKEVGLTHSQASKCKNFFALGIIFWLYNRPLVPTLQWLEKKFQRQPLLIQANRLALQAGYNYALTTELFTEQYTVKKAQLPPGRYRQVTGNEALSLGCAAAAVQSQRPFLIAGYPITPASNILQQLAQLSHFGIQTFQAEDEIAAMGACIGAAFGGSLALTCTSGPGLDLKSEALGLAVMAELPVVVVDVQRAGPSTGMPTKTEQADLLMALYGRHGECPLPVLAPASPGDCFAIVVEAYRIAVKYITPVIILSDGYLATGAEPWRLPKLTDLPDLSPYFYDSKPTHSSFNPYQRDPATLARPWAIPGTPGLEHRIGGLEKDNATGNISYDPANHQLMVETRAAKVQGIAKDIPALTVQGKPQGDVLMVSWGSTYGACLTAVEELQAQGHAVALLHLRYLNPLPLELKAILSKYKKILVPELNLGQLSKLLRAAYLIDVISYNKVTGKPFLVSELRERLMEVLQDE